MNSNNTVHAKKLPINIDPLLNSYSHHAHFFSITKNSDVLSEYDAKVSSISNFFKIRISEQAKIYNLNCNSKIDIENDEYKFTLHSHNHASRSCFYFDNVLGNGNFTVKVDKLKSLNPWSKVGIMMMDKKFENSVTFYINGEGYLIYEMHNFLDNKSLAFERLKETSLYGWLKLNKVNEVIELFYSDTGQDWEKCNEYKIDLSEDFYVGIFVNQEESYFENWLYTNYIQIYYEKLPNLQLLDFYTGIQRSLYNKYSSNPFVAESAIDVDVIRKMMTFSEYFVRCIDKGFYICAISDDYKDETELIYGYSVDYKSFLKCNYSLPLNQRCSEISYKALNNAHIKTIYLFKRIFPWTSFELNINTIVEFLKDYIFAVNTDRKLASYSFAQERAYGIEVYDSLLKNLNQNSLDVKMYQLLVEHKKLMKMRVKYLYDNRILDEEDFRTLYYAFSVVEDKAIIALKLFQKYLVSGDISNEEDLATIFSEMKKMEIENIEKLICYLNAKSNV